MKTTVLRKGSRYHGYTIIGRMDSRKKSYRQVYRCMSDGKMGVLVRFILSEVPTILSCPVEGVNQPIEYVFCNTYQVFYPFDVLPNIWSCGSDSDDAWYVRDYVDGRTLKEEIHDYHEMSSSNGDMELLLSVSNWLAQNGNLLFKLMPTYMKYNLNPDNLYVTSDEEGNPRLIIVDFESVVAVEYGFYATELVKFDSRFLPPEILCDMFDEKSYVYVFAMLMAYCLKGSLPDEDMISGERYEDIVYMQMAKDSIIDSLNITQEKKNILNNALESNPDERPSFRAFVHQWIKEDSVKEERNESLEDESASKANISLGEANRFDGMFQSSNGGPGFAAIAGMEELKKNMTQSVIYPIKYPDVAKQYGITMPNGMLLYGPPGCGKTFFAEKFCEQVGWPYIKIKGADLGGQWHRQGVEGISHLFMAAERQSKIHGSTVCVIIDEADGIIPIRNQEMSIGAAAETNQFLTELETCRKRGIFVIATSNDPRQIDQAALRTGRLGDSLVYVPLPDDDTKNAILEMGLSKLPCEGIKTKEVIHLMKNFSSSDVADIARKAGIYAMSQMISNIESGDAGNVVPVTEEIIRKTIADITPSLSEDEISRHLRIHESFSHKYYDKRTKIGFR